MIELSSIDSLPAAVYSINNPVHILSLNHAVVISRFTISDFQKKEEIFAPIDFLSWVKNLSGKLYLIRNTIDRFHKSFFGSLALVEYS